MMRIAMAAVIAALLLAVDFLAFHDFAEAHTFREWLMLLASVLVFIYLARDVMRRPIRR
jgi:hypothetical protein